MATAIGPITHLVCFNEQSWIVEAMEPRILVFIRQLLIDLEEDPEAATEGWLHNNLSDAVISWWANQEWPVEAGSGHSPTWCAPVD